MKAVYSFTQISILLNQFQTSEVDNKRMSISSYAKFCVRVSLQLFYQYMKEIFEKYDVVVGLEIHAQLLAKSKAFSYDKAEYGAPPNQNVGVITLGHPGTLPRHNKEAVRMAVKVGLALGCDITEYNQYARKNYFYADLPKGYQITQDKTPLCRGGFVTVKDADGRDKNIHLTRIHMEEDSGKSIHDMDMEYSVVDYNRAGTALIEIVSEPEIRSGEEAFQFVTEIRRLLRYLDVCDGNMEEGSLRCDANVSIKLKGSEVFGTKVEVKNMNSITNVRKAIEYEVRRQHEAVQKGEELVSETRRFDALKNITFSMRTKEQVNDYRYFPEPDLPPLIVSKDFIAEVRQDMPLLPEQLVAMFVTELGLSQYTASVLTESKETAAYFIEITRHTKNHKAAANWVMGEIKGYLNLNALDITRFPLSAPTIARLIALIDEGKLSNSVATQVIFPELVKNPMSDPLEIAARLNVIQTSDAGFLQELIDEVLTAYPEKVAEYKSGKEGLLGLFVGEVMKKSKGKADPKLTNEMLRERLG